MSDLAAIVGAEYVRAATPDDAIAGVVPQQVITPGNAEEVARVLAWADVQGLAVAPRGGGTKLDWGQPPRRLDLVLSLSRLDALVEHAWGDMTVTVQAGRRVGDVQRDLAEHGQRLALDPLWPESATIGGVLATNDNGSLRLRYGGLRDMIIGITIALADGTLARSGGKVVKNVAGYDLQKLMTGAFGTLGIIVTATFRVYPLPKGQATLHFAPATTGDLDRLVRSLLASVLTPVAVRIQAGSERPILVAVTCEGLPTALEDATARLRAIVGAIPETDQSLAAREDLFGEPEQALVVRFGVLPGDLGSWLDEVARIAARHGLIWGIEAQAPGTGLAHLLGDPTAFTAALGAMRAAADQRGGSLVVLQMPPALRGQIDVWGPGGDSLALMRRVKDQFDPHAILNPGRFIGGI